MRCKIEKMGRQDTRQKKWGDEMRDEKKWGHETGNKKFVRTKMRPKSLCFKKWF